MIRIICVGKLKEKYLNDLINDYLQRINKYHKITIEELKDSDIETESNILLSKIKSTEYNILLDRLGKNISSLELANTINKIFIYNSNINFIIGGSDGVSEKVKKSCNEMISFGIITFPHGFFRGILLEQIYRSFKINNNETYHK